ncbi:DDX58 [Mytilus edulis]|uniref:DDX58 n=1 Tax=Mytilus edulis TaxID=6550 RepID=A0A8S3SU74_MYTED|nr:DDX58 [Mytilus edulis]
MNTYNSSGTQPLIMFILICKFHCTLSKAIYPCMFIADDNVQDFDYLLEDPLPILKLDVNVQNSAFQNESVLYEEVNKFVTGMYDAIDINGVPVNGSKREVMMFTGPENDLKVQSKEPDMDGFEDIVIDMNTDDHWRKFIMELCQGQIVNNIIPSGILISIGSILSNDYQWLIDFIDGDFVSYENTSAWSNLMNVFQKTLSANIRPQDILPYLTEKSIISDKDSIEVDQLCGMYGENEAMFRLLTHLPKRKPNDWYPEFINILYENGYAYVVKKSTQRKLQVHSSALFESIDEKPEISNKKQSSDNRLEQDDWLYLHRSTMHELSTSIYETDLMYYKPNESANENLLAWTAQTKLPSTALRDQMNEGYEDLEDTETEDYDYDDDGLSQQNEPLTLRSYQQELARPGLQGKNCIIVAPAGSGKTHVALKIIQEHMTKVRARRHPKVIFWLNKKHLHNNKRHVLVVTSQLLVNALIEQDVKIDDFTLMVFDECHLARADHSYNRIMHVYMDQKMKYKADKTRLPMVSIL